MVLLRGTRMFNFGGPGCLRWPLSVTFLAVLAFTGREAVSTGSSFLRPFRPCGPCWCNGTVVDCSSQLLTSVPTPANGLPPGTTRLFLCNNSLSSLGPSVFSLFPSLRELDLSHNVIVNLSNDAFDGLSSLEMLNISSNLLTLSGNFSDRGPFHRLNRLYALDLSNNSLADMNPTVFGGYVSPVLKWLSLSKNGITNKNETDWPIRYLTNLTYLDLSRNNLEYVTRTMFTPGLRNLNISYNSIPLNEDSYPDDAFENLAESLIYLKMKGNCNNVRESVPLKYPDTALSKLRNLEMLWLDGLYEQGFGPGFKNLTKLWNLNLSGKWDGFCNITTLSNDTFMNISSSLHILDLSLCYIEKIDTHAFAPLRDFLHSLQLSNNMNLGFDTLGKALLGLQGSKLAELFIDAIVQPHQVFNMITEHNTKNFRNTSLELITARNNRLEVFCPGALKNMPPTLSRVVLYGNNLAFGAYFQDLKYLVNLTYLEVDGRAFAPRPPNRYPAINVEECTDFGYERSQCRTRWSPYKSPHWYTFSEEERRSMYGEAVDLQEDGMPPYELPPKLQILRSRWNQLYFRLEGIHFDPNNSLDTLDIHNNLLTTWSGSVTGLHKLKTLNLGYNLAIVFSREFFESFPSVTNLTLSNNHMREAIQADTDGELFGPLRNVEVLDLSSNYLNALPRQIFRGLVNLRTLNLSRNDIVNFRVNITHMQNLTTLDLSFNYIKYLSPEIMNHLDFIARTLEVHIDLTFNPLSCTCAHMTFLTWVEQSDVRLPSSQHYTCLMADGNFYHMTDIFKTIAELQSSCIDKVGMLIGAVVCTFCLNVALVGALIYRFRWKIRYLYYASRLAYRRIDSSSGDDHFEYDAFVSYSSDNNDFVQGELLDELETRAGLRLNVHSRDFTPGMPIPTNIVGAVHSSRRTLVVLTRALLESDWCYYELQMATMEASYTGRDVLVFLLYEDVPSHQLPREMLYNLQASTYINYPSANAEPSLTRDFWERLAQAIRQ